MTGKRFTYDEFEDSIIDNLSGKTHWGLDDILNNKLNELHEENEQLKKENKELKQTIETICEDYEKSHGMDIRNAEWFTAW